MKTLLICHHGATLDHEGMLRWLASFSEVAGVVVLRERAGRTRQRVKSQIKRAGLTRFLDVLAFRVYYRLLLASEDRRWEEARMSELRAEFPRLPDAPVLETHSPNSPEAEEFIRRAAPDRVDQRRARPSRVGVVAAAGRRPGRLEALGEGQRVAAEARRVRVGQVVRDLVDLHRLPERAQAGEAEAVHQTTSPRRKAAARRQKPPRAGTASSSAVRSFATSLRRIASSSMRRGETQAACQSLREGTSAERAGRRFRSGTLFFRP